METSLERAQEKRDEMQKEMRDHSLRFLLEGLNQLATVAASALALLVTFRSVLVGSNPHAVWLIKLSWVCLGFAVVGAIWSKLGVSETLVVVEPDLGALKRLVTKLERNALIRKLSVWAFIVGIAALVAFGIVNL